MQIIIHHPHRLPRSSPSSPAPSKKGKRPASASPIRRRLLSSPLLNRRMRKSRGESSDEEGLLQDDSSTASYRDLETFQKAQLRQKVYIANISNYQEIIFDKYTTLKKRMGTIPMISMLFTAQAERNGNFWF